MHSTLLSSRLSSTVFPMSALVITACLLFAASTLSHAQGMLEEVVVTAQKREQSLQDVPIAVSAFSGQMLQESGVKDVFDLQVNAPGLTVNQNQNATTSSFSIRGIGGGGNNFGIESSVGVYVDGSYRARQNSMISQLVDIASIEVLRGPQGTLFGRNTLSGAIHFKTVAPDHEGNGFLEATAGTMNLLNISGATSLSLVEDVLALRFTGFSSQRDGWVDNLTTPGDDEINDRDRFGLRAQALFTPNDNLSMRLIVDYGELDEVCCGTTVLHDNNRINLTSPAGALGTDAILEGRGATFIPESKRFDNEVAINSNPTSKATDQGVSLQIDYLLGDEYTLTSITSWRDFESFDFIDADFTDLNALTDTNLAEQSSISQELRVAFTGEKLNYVAGAYYFNQDLDSTSTLTFGDDTEAIAAAFLGFPPAFIIPLQFPLSGATASTGPGAFFPDGGFATDFNTQEHESWAVFGQLDWLINDSLTLTAGLRYSDEEKILNTVYIESGDELGFFTPAFAATQRRDNVDEVISDEQITGTLKLSWQANDDILTYASLSTGYKAGGTNTDRIDPAFEQIFDAETSISYEVGMKAEFPDNSMRLNVSLYYTPVDDFQVGTFTGSGFNVQNAATVDTYGGEVEFLWQPNELTTLQASYALGIADFDEFERGNCFNITPFRLGIPDPGGRDLVTDANGNETVVPTATPLTPDFCDRSGGRLGTNPEHFFVVSARRELNISDTMTGFVMGEYTYNSDMVLDQSNEPLSEQGGFGLANFRAGLYLNQYDAEITLWGRNIFDEEYNGTSFPGVLQDGKQIAYRREPATWGITLRKDW